MGKLFTLLFFFVNSDSYSQTYKDTKFSVRAFTCSCKYNINISDDNIIFDRDEKVAHYPGGEKEWKKFLKKNLDEGFKGKHEVQVQFQVSKNGDLSEFTLLNRTPNQKYEEVLRVLKLSGKWFPSVQKGFCVKSSVRLVLEL